MAFTEMAGSASITNTEYSLPNASTTLTLQTDACVLQVVIDGVANMVAGDQFLLQIYTRTNAGTKRVAYACWLTGVQVGCVTCPSIVAQDGWDVTLTRVSATSRTIGWSLRKIT